MSVVIRDDISGRESEFNILAMSSVIRDRKERFQYSTLKTRSEFRDLNLSLQFSRTNKS